MNLTQSQLELNSALRNEKSASNNLSYNLAIILIPSNKWLGLSVDSDVVRLYTQILYAFLSFFLYLVSLLTVSTNNRVPQTDQLLCYFISLGS
jgi:hypothetical protein